MRLSKTKIKHNLNQLKLLYEDASRSSSNEANLHMTFYSKLALIEYCGWLEVSIDILVRRIICKINDAELIRIGENSVKTNYGFTYDNHFRVLLVRNFGLKNTEILLNELRVSGDLALLESKLNTFKTLRNEAAHNYFTGVGAYNAPSFYVSEIDAIFPIFQKIYAHFVQFCR